MKFRTNFVSIVEARSVEVRIIIECVCVCCVVLIPWYWFAFLKEEEHVNEYDSHTPGAHYCSISSSGVSPSAGSNTTRF